MLQSTMIEVYGMSEALYISVNVPYRCGSAGIPVIESLRIVDGDGTACGQGQEGEILIRGAGVFSGYLNEPEETAAVFSCGWFRTGDTGYLDPDGYLFITGRVKESDQQGWGEDCAPRAGSRALLPPRYPGRNGIPGKRSRSRRGRYGHGRETR